ncbi:MAG: glutamate 5-kinase [Deltaproteobacteria bacterium]|nr:MAG: glutamate 5-kinase [Deltaproteobacteria bacterium]
MREAVWDAIQGLTMTGDETRSALRDCKRLVVKIGSRALCAEGGRFAEVAAQVATQVEAGRKVVIVSSGAVALGRARLGLTDRPKKVSLLQAAAATGQSLLMRAYEDAFEPLGIHVAQVLLTHDAVTDRDRYLHAREAIDELLRLGVVPVINENDTVSIDELRFGDNDQLAAMVCTLVGADLLVLLSDVVGILDDQEARIPLVRDVADIEHFIKPPEGDVGLGGMQSKVEAARRATLRGLPVVVGPAASSRFLDELMQGGDVGTLLLPHGSPLPSRKHWIAYTLKPQGRIVVDAGACRALEQRQASLLPAGVVSTTGSYKAGDAVLIVSESGKAVARGLARYGADAVNRLAGGQSRQIAERIGTHAGDEIVHRDDIVLAHNGG